MVGTSLEVWWLRLCGSTVGGVGLISGQGTKILYVVRCSQKINKIKNKKDAVNICNGLLLSHKKEWNNALSSNMDGPRDCHTSEVKSEESEVRVVKSETDKYHMTPLICRI